MPRKVIIPIYDGDDFARLSDLRRAVAVAEQAQLIARLQEDPRAGDAVDLSEEIQEKRDAYDAFVDEAAGRAEEWTLQALGFEAWRQLLVEHPPRKVPDPEDPEKQVTHPDDGEPFNVNTETFAKAILEYVDPDDETHRTILAPEFASVAEMRRRVRRLAEGEIETLWVAAHQLNTGAIADPKLQLFSSGVQRSDET